MPSDPGSASRLLLWVPAVEVSWYVMWCRFTWWFPDAFSHDVLVRQDPWEDMWCLERVKIGLSGQRCGACIASLAVLCWFLLICTSLRERHCGQLLASWLVLVTFTDLCWFDGGLVAPPLLIHACYSDTIDLDCGYPVKQRRNRPKELLLNRLISPCPSYHLFFPTIGLWARKGTKAFENPC